MEILLIYYKLLRNFFVFYDVLYTMVVGIVYRNARKTNSMYAILSNGVAYLSLTMIAVLRPPLCTQQAKWVEVKDETPFRYANVEVRTQVVVICDPTRYQLDHGGVF